MRKQFQKVSVLAMGVLLTGCFGDVSEQGTQSSSSVVSSAPPKVTAQGQLPVQANRQTPVAAVKQLNSTQMQQIQQMETQVRGMLQQVQGSQKNGGQLSQQQLAQMQQQVQQMMQQLQSGGATAPKITPSQAPQPTQAAQQAAQAKSPAHQQPKQKAQPKTPVKTQPKKQSKPKVRYSTKYTYRGQPLTLEQERKWERLMRRQQKLNQAAVRNRAHNQAARAVRQAGARISNQMEYNSMRNACHIANNCRVERYR